MKRTPEIAVLPQGMTNMIAADVGLQKRGAKGLQRLLRARQEGRLAAARVTRPLLCLENAKDTPPQYGMFFGGAAIYRAIEACRGNVHPLQMEADTAAAVTLAGLLGRWIFRRGEGDGVVRGDPITTTLDGIAFPRQDCLIVLATTLERLIMGSRPFWNQGPQDLHFTAIGYPPKQLLRHAYRVLYGAPERQLPPGSYHSESANRIELDMDCPFTLDGELFEPEQGKACRPVFRRRNHVHTGSRHGPDRCFGISRSRGM